MAEVQQSLRILNYASLSTITLMVYDCILSFSDEVEYIWSAKHWKIPNFLYIISRYYPIFHLSILFYIRNLTNKSLQIFIRPDKIPLTRLGRCSAYRWYQGFGGVICILPPVTAIFTIRIYAIYNSKRVRIIVWFLWVVETLGELATTIRVTIGEHKDIIGYGPGCLTVTKSDPVLYRSELLAWVPALTGSVVLFLLMLHRLGEDIPRIFNGPARSAGDEPQDLYVKSNRTVQTFIKDGTIYFFFIFVATTLTMVSDLASNLGVFNDVWHPYFLMLYSISGARLVLNLRINAVLEEHTSTQDMLSIVNTDFDSVPGTLQGGRNPDVELNFL